MLTGKCAAPTGFHANHLAAYVRSEALQLCARELLAHRDFAAQVKPDQMKNCRAKINADRLQFPWDATSASLAYTGHWLGRSGGPSHY